MNISRRALAMDLEFQSLKIFKPGLDIADHPQLQK